MKALLEKYKGNQVYQSTNRKCFLTQYLLMHKITMDKRIHQMVIDSSDGKLKKVQVKKKVKRR